MFENAFKAAIEGAWPMVTIFLVAIITIRLSYILTTKNHLVLHEEILNLLFIVYILLLFEILTGTENSNGSGFNIVPFTEILRYKVGSKAFIYNVIGNILVFVPFGFFISRYINAKRVGPVLIDALITSLTVELVQLQIGRSFDIDDILLNISGAVIGFLLYIALVAIKEHLPSFLKGDFLYNILCIIILVIIVLYILKISGIWWFI